MECECGLFNILFSYEDKDIGNFSNQYQCAFKQFQCELCQKSFKRKDEFNFHVCLQGSIQRNNCEKYFGLKEMFSTHRCLRNVFQCDICLEFFLQFGQLQTYFGKHLTLKGFEYLDNEFSGPDKLQFRSFKIPKISFNDEKTILDMELKQLNIVVDG